MSQRANALSIDVEDWFHPELVRRTVPEEERTARVADAIEPLRGLLRESGARATFFVLGPILEAEAELIRSLHREGHEIACHGMTHRPLWELDPPGLRAELREWRAILRSVDPEIPAIGYRAPTFSLDQSTAWALEVLAEEGFRYDSSIFPARNHVYGVAGAPLEPYRPDPGDVARHRDGGPLLELPVSVLALGRLRLPVAGGFYLRALPLPLFTWALRRVTRERPALLYCHPWEFDAGTPRRRLGLLASWITYVGMNAALGRLEHLLAEFPFDRIDRVLGEA